MKKILLLIVAFSALFVQAQTWVSTTAQSKRVVIEEFTGQKCQFCPDGHKKANDYKATNPSKIFLINIHSGGYATPDATYPMDLRTSYGDYIDANSGLSGYPAGAVNRFDAPWAVDRGQFSVKGNLRLAESSPVNVAVRSNLDLKTMNLTTEVEVYYTANSSLPVNKLNVVLLQDSILGAQIGGTTWYPANYKNGLYIHNHVLRKLITSSFLGDSITPTTSGTYIKKTFVTRLPGVIGNVPVDYKNLQVVAFVGESLSKIYSGDEWHVTYDNTLTGIDMEIVDNGTAISNTDYCQNSVTPKIKVKNNSSTAITSFDVITSLNGTDYPQSITQSIAANSSVDLTLNQINYTPKAINSIVYNGCYNINGTGLFDNSSTDTFYKAYISFKDNALSSWTEGFESNLGTTVLSGGRQSVISGATAGASGTTSTVRIPLHSSWNNAGVDNNIMFGKANLSSTSNSTLSYYYAYSDGSQGGDAPHIKTSYSDDCGTSWKPLDDLTCVSTGNPSSPSAFYIPVSSEYKLRDVDLTALKGKSNLIFKITSVPGSTGNAMYVDQINLKGAVVVTPSMDSFRKDVAVVTATPLNVEITGGATLTAAKVYTWTIDKIALAPGWSLASICDNGLCVNYPDVQTRDFTAIGTTAGDIMKLDIAHNKINGYGYVNIKIAETDDATKFKIYRFALKVTGGIVVSAKTIILDSAYLKVNSIAASGTPDNHDVKANYIVDNLVSGDTIKWTVKSISPSPLPSGWSVSSLKDNNGTYTYAAGLSKKFAFKPSSENFLTVNFKHSNKPGYAFATINTFRTKDSSATSKNLKVSLLTTAGASITLLSDLNDKLLYYFDKKVFIDQEFQGSVLNVFDMNGRLLQTEKINSTTIDFNSAKGIYLITVSNDGATLKSTKVSVE